MIADATIQELLTFRRERDWEQFHSPKNLAIALSVEASELLQEFEWTGSEGLPRDPMNGMTRIKLEIADVAIVVAYLAHDLGIDIEEAVQVKLALNRERYPVSTSRGSSAKYDET